jgi:osmotically-inducible protein OsmY
MRQLPLLITISLFTAVLACNTRSKSNEIPDSQIDRITVSNAGVDFKDYTEQMAQQAREEAKRFGDKVGSSAKDAWIHGKVVAQLLLACDMQARRINVDVNGGIVTLRGAVPSKEAKAGIEAVARKMEGVKEVHNLLKVESI